MCGAFPLLVNMYRLLPPRTPPPYTSNGCNILVLMLSSFTSKIQELQNRVFSVLRVLCSNYTRVVPQRYSYDLGLWFRVRVRGYEKQGQTYEGRVMV